MTLSEFHHLDPMQQILFDEAYRQSKLDPPTYICMGKVKISDPFYKDFLDHGIFHKETLKFTGVVRLTKKGKQIYENIQKQKYGIQLH